MKSTKVFAGTAGALLLGVLGLAGWATASYTHTVEAVIDEHGRGLVRQRLTGPLPPLPTIVIATGCRSCTTVDWMAKARTLAPHARLYELKSAPEDGSPLAEHLRDVLEPKFGPQLYLLDRNGRVTDAQWETEDEPTTTSRILRWKNDAVR